MNPILQSIDSVVTAISGVLYMPWVPLLLVVAGLTFTFRSKFIQVRLLRETFRVLSEKPKTEGAVSSFGALMVSTASRVGTGNIVGVASAICLGRLRCGVLDVGSLRSWAARPRLSSPPWRRSTSAATRTARATAAVLLY